MLLSTRNGPMTRLYFGVSEAWDKPLGGTGVCRPQPTAGWFVAQDKFPSMFWECSPGSKFQSLVVLRHFATHHFLVPDWCLHAKERPLFEYNTLSVWVWGIAILGYPCRWESCYCQELKTDGRRNHSRWGLATPFVSPEFGGTPFWGQKLVVAL